MHFLMPAPHLVLGSGVDAEPGLAIWTTITFLLVAVLLRWKVWGPLMHVIDEREKSIKDAVDQARVEREKAEKLLVEQEKKAVEARRELAESLRLGQIEAGKAKDEAVAAARAAGAAEIASARQQIDEERRKAVAEIKEVAIELALAAASKLVSKELNDTSHRALATEYVKDLEKKAPGQRAVAGA